MHSLSHSTLRELNSFGESPKTPYYKQRFQVLRMTGNTLFHRISSIFFLVISTFFYLFGSNLSGYYRSLSTYHLYRSKNPSITLRRFPGRVIDFSINVSARGVPPLLGGESELDGLKRIYGGEEIDRRLAWKPPFNFTINSKKIKRPQGGFCAGGSAHFAFSYLKKLEEGKTPIEALEEIAPIYSNGAPVTAQLSQVFYGAIDREKDADLEDPHLPKFIKDYGENFHLHMKLKQLHLIPFHMMGLKVGQPYYYVTSEKEDPCGVVFKENAELLPSGVYHLGLDFYPKETILDEPIPGHGLIFIKTDQGNFLFDINYGTLILSSPIEIWNLINDYYPISQGDCLTIFNSLRLKKS